MSGVSPDITTHRLSIYKEAKPFTQKKQKMDEEKRVTTQQEADKLVKASFIKKAHNTTLLANVVMVKKANDKWRMCTDYVDLNKACPKDSYPLTSIDRLVDGAVDHNILIFFYTIKSRCTQEIRKKQRS